MIKKNILFFITILSIQICNAQFLSETAEGKAALLLPLSKLSIGVDIGKTEIAIGINNYAKALNKNNIKIFRNRFYGANLGVKNSSGIGNLFSTGSLVPAGNLLGFTGFNINNNQAIITAWNKSEFNNIKNLELEKRRELVNNYKIDILKIIQIALPEIDESILRGSTDTKYSGAVSNSNDGLSLNKAIRSLLADKNPQLADFVLAFKDLLEPRKKSYIEALSKIDATKELDEAFKKFSKTHKVKQLTPFIFGGIEARNFSWYTGLNPTSLPKSFIDTLFRGGSLGLGINGQVGGFWLGITYAYSDGDNFSNLTSKEYTLRTLDTAGNQSLLSEKKITGYSGQYAKVESNMLNIDLLKEFKIDDTAKLILSLYYKAIVASRNKDFLKDISTVGLGVYLLGNKSKFLGGLYVELPDIENKIEKGKPETERNIRPSLKRLTFGVSTKLALGAIFGFTDRPRKPD